RPIDRPLRAAGGAGRPRRALRRRRRGRDGGAARAPLPPLRGGRGRAHQGGEDRPADLPEPAADRGGPAGLRSPPPGPAGQGGGAGLRARHPLLRPLHLLRDALSAPDRGAAPMTAARAKRTVRILGFGNPLAGDDAAGPLAAERLRARLGGRAEVVAAELAGHALLDWMAGADAVLLIDATFSDRPPGSLTRCRFREGRLEEGDEAPPLFREGLRGSRASSH